jgi:hypothetical protein
MSGERAIVLHRPGRISWDRQVRACMAYAGQHGYELGSVVRSKDEAVRLIREGLAKLVLAATAVDDDGPFAQAVELAGGRLEYCRGRPRRPPVERDTEEIVRRLSRHEETSGDIAKLLGLPLQRVRDILRGE